MRPSSTCSTLPSRGILFCKQGGYLHNRTGLNVSKGMISGVWTPHLSKGLGLTRACCLSQGVSSYTPHKQPSNHVMQMLNKSELCMTWDIISRHSEMSLSFHLSTLFYHACSVTLRDGKKVLPTLHPFNTQCRTLGGRHISTPTNKSSN